jgi:hypothetical protein
MILGLFIFQVFTGVLEPTCEHPREKNSNIADLLLKPFKNKINSLSIYNNEK